MVERHNYLYVRELIDIRELGHQLFMKIQAMRRSLIDVGVRPVRRRSLVSGRAE